MSAKPDAVVKAMPLTCTGHSRPVTHLCFSGTLAESTPGLSLNNSQAPKYLLISACKDGKPILRNGVTGDWIGTYLGHKGAIWCARISKDGSWAATSSADFSAKVWNAKTGQLVASLPHRHIVRTCDLIPGADSSFRATLQNEQFNYSDNNMSSSSLFSTDINTKNNSNTNKNNNNNDNFSQFMNNYNNDNATQSSPLNPSSSDLKLVTASQDSIVRIWNVPTLQIEMEWSVVGPSMTGHASPRPVRSVLWISLSTVVTITFDGLVTWWDISISDRSSAENNNNNNNNIHDNSTLPRKPTKIREIDLKGITGDIELDGDNILIPCNQTAYIISSGTGELVKQFHLDYKLSAFCVDKEHKQFLTGCVSDTWIRIHDYETGKIIETLKGHHGPVHTCSYSPDGAIVATGSEDGTIRLWKMKPGPFGLWVS